MDEVEKIIQYVRRGEVIEPTISPWASTVVPAKKKDGSTLFCVDYSLLNSVTKKNSYPLQRIDDTPDGMVSWKICLVYLNERIVVGTTFDDHVKNLEGVFRTLLGSNMTLNPKKSTRFHFNVNFLGHIVSNEGVSMNPTKVAATQKWLTLADEFQLMRFLGLCTYYRRFDPGFADLAKPLTRLREKGR